MDPADLVGALRRRGATVGCAESLTGGLVCAALTSVPGSSAVVRGGVVAYAADLKSELLGVPEELVDVHGAVSAHTALAMADGARRVLGTDIGLATTGVAGPEPSEGKPVGTVYVAVTAMLEGEQGRAVRALRLHGSREQIREATVDQALQLLSEILAGDQTPVRQERYGRDTGTTHE